VRSYSHTLLVLVTFLGCVVACSGFAFSCVGTYAIGVSAAPTKILCGGSSAITAHVTINGTPIQGHTISFTVSGPGSVNPTTRDTNASGDASVTYTSQTAGTATITAKDLDQIGQPTATCTVRVFCISVSDDPIWWFSGATPANYATTSTLTASGPSGTFSWVVTAGTAIVGLGPNLQSTYTGNPVDGTSKGQSADEDDVSIQLKWNGSAVGSVALTVKSPASFEAKGTGDAALGVGFYSIIWYKCKDQFGDVLPNAIDINEAWTTADTSDFAGEDWPRPATSPWVQKDPAFWADRIWVNIVGLNPAVQNPQNPLSATKIDHWGQRFRVGSTVSPNGKFIQDNAFQRYRDHARHE